MADLPEHASPKAARILAAAGELLLDRGSKGVTIAEVAKRAHIGKGTVYLYWKTKEDLLLGLVCRDFLAMADEAIAAVTADPDLARPSRLCPRMLRTATERRFVSGLRSGDDHLLGVLADDPRSAELLAALGPDAVMADVLPIWRDHGLARTDWPLAEQALALHALTTGFAAAAVRPPRLPVDDPERVLAAAVTALLGPEQAGPEQVASAAAEGIRHLVAGRALALEVISPGA
ncbi:MULTISPECIES: TetR/AcrR family transcriptional regulator [Saccharopolyspora]|uniref:TetR/AcrR family transcriptional regulator n=1 Tax=Saccharopolyspora gregorii TaxID=33914 RepID=A0ABP6RQV4_9PSEU|nr:MULTISPECIES: TetR/AcrR family transcriptional regulator [unclassified Saccharopolyspora]MCA1186323.1 TetR/AcrR family transcriptional regulator [Saccharopolyspora sp. 6T]MCA1192158.1 TetR/AcrR family transcriptional regulator [Saccharopolyspora sp. 6V]MCA1279982.1 TetR/AcrR family transcriptional regulator [Saccharopolyspora sp. 7B]